jgi:hypothetical protein
VHYSLIGNAGNTRQLVRYVSNSVGSGPPNPCTAANNCRVLANDVRHPNANNSALFAYDAGNQAVVMSLQIEYANPLLPTGRSTSPVLTSSVRMRN